MLMRFLADSPALSAEVERKALEIAGADTAVASK